MSTSPNSASSESVLEWDEGAVNDFVLSVLGAKKYEGVVYEHGITGDVLVAMDHESLSDMGMSSLGHRLKLLRAVWEVKKDQGMEMSQDDWQPQDLPEVVSQAQEVDRLLETVSELQERVMNLERDHVRMLNALDEYSITIPLASSADGDLISSAGLGGARGGGGVPAPPAINRSKQPPAQIYAPAHSHSNSQGHAHAHPHAAGPRSSDSASFGPSLTPTTSTSNAAAMASAQQYSFDSPSQMDVRDRDRDREEFANPGYGRPALAPPPFKRMMSGNSMVAAGAQNQAILHGHGQADAGVKTHRPSALANDIGASTPAFAPAPALAQSALASSQSQMQVQPSAASTPGGEQAGASNVGAHGDAGNAASTAGGSTSASASATAIAKESANRAAKSFRVTLEDPCWKVLPAALKKYKINDDWKLYALFICFGNTERCLSYDEKPLLLFQKLKEGGQKPVFMLRHIKDIKSPIAVAQQKQAVKMGLPANTTQNVLPKIRATTDTSISPVKPDTLAPLLGSREGGPAAGFPEQPSPSPTAPSTSTATATGTGTGNETAGAAQGVPGQGTVLDDKGNVQRVTYAVAIYPYLADREDEFDVPVGATFVIMNKTKGWYVVQKDLEGLGNVVYDTSKTGWVPAGCLLELSSPISLVSPSIAPGESLPAYPGLAALPPTAILSSSYPGIVLMDYAAKADTELSIMEGEKVKVYKKYTHWSYTIKIDTGDRGWVPSWFIGKLATASTANSAASTITGGSGGSGQESNPSTATLTAIPRSAVPNPNGSLDSVREGAGGATPAVTVAATATATATATSAATTPVTAGSMGSGPAHAPAPGGGEEGEEIDFGKGGDS